MDSEITIAAGRRRLALFESGLRCGSTNMLAGPEVGYLTVEVSLRGLPLGRCSGIGTRLLEAVLEDRIGQHIGHQARELKEWINEAEHRRFLTNAQLRNARIIQRLGNTVLHEKSASDADAHESVNALRSILGELYR